MLRLPFPKSAGFQGRHFGIALLSAVIVILFLYTLSSVLPMNLRGALLQRNPNTVAPVTGVFISRGYLAQPNERGSVLLEAGESLLNFEGMTITVVTDPVRAKILSVRRTAVTQGFEISTNFVAPGVVHIALLGIPRQVNPGQGLLEIELQLANHTVNTAGSRIDLRLLDAKILVEGNRIIETSHDGLITMTSNQDALTLPLVPLVSDIEPGIFPLVQQSSLIIRGQALPASARVLLGSHPIPVISASPSQIVAAIPDDTAPGAYSVSVESVLADEKAVVFSAPGVTGTVDILENLLFLSPNPVLFVPGQSNPGVVLWIPVHNPLGSNDPVIGSVDLSRIGGDPNVVFSGLGTPAIGPGGATINWFRVPVTGTIALPDSLHTNVDYPITVRAENRTLTRDQVTTILELRSQIPSGAAPFFGTIETVPGAASPGDAVTFFADVTDADGIDTVQLVSVRLTSLGGSVQNLTPVLSIPAGGTPLPSMTFSTTFTLPANVNPGTYPLDFTARDENGNQATTTFSFIVSAPGVALIGSPPQFSGRLEARPAIARPGSNIDFFAGVQDPDGTNTISLVSIDLISIGGGVELMTPTLQSAAIGTQPMVYELPFTLPSTVPSGTYNLPVRAVDIHGRSASASIVLTVDASSGGGGGSAPQFAGRLEATPAAVGLGGDLTLFVGVQDLDGTDTISQVTIDLVSIGGSILELDPAVNPVAGSTQPVIYTGEFTLPGSVRPGAYALEVRAMDESGNLTKATIALTVSALQQSGSPPAILQLFATPPSVPADDRTDVAFTVEVEDGDGVEDIETVSINLAPIKQGIAFLDLESESDGGRKGIFTSERVRVPTTVSNGSYDLTVEVEDSQGNTVRRTLRLTVGRVASGGIPAFRETRFVPGIVRPDDSTQLFVELQDENGTDTVTVIADFTDVRGSVETLDALIDFPTGTFAFQNTFASSDISIPDDLPQGVYDIPLTALDTSGNVVNASARLRVERSGADEGQSPHIDATKTFQAPRIFVNDDEATGEIHILVNDPDDDVLTVIANLGSLGTADSASGREGIGDIDLLCNESRSLVCMHPSVPEGLTGRWFVLKDIVIPGTTLPTTEPYLVEFTAIDTAGHTDKVKLPVFVGGAELADILRVSPHILAVVPVDEDEIEVVLSSPVDTRSIDRNGSQFVVRPTLSAQSSLKIRRVSWDTTGRLLYMQTDPLTPGETYTFSVIPSDTATVVPLTDVYGNRFTADQGGSSVFTGFRRTNEVPRIESVRAVDSTHLDVQFSSPVLPSSVHPDLLPSRVTLRSVTSGEQVSVRGGVLQDHAKVLRLEVNTLREGDRYTLRIAGVLASGPIEAPAPGVEKTFTALFPRAGDGSSPIIIPTADLNKDGRVDFADFTLFSAVYDTEYGFDEAQELSDEEAKRLQTGRSSSSRSGTPRNAAPGLPLEDSFGGEVPDLQF